MNLKKLVGAAKKGKPVRCKLGPCKSEYRKNGLAGDLRLERVYELEERSYHRGQLGVYHSGNMCPIAIYEGNKWVWNGIDRKDRKNIRLLEEINIQPKKI